MRNLHTDLENDNGHDCVAGGGATAASVDAEEKKIGARGGCCGGCCDDYPIRRRMCIAQLQRDAESCRRCGRGLRKLLSCVTLAKLKASTGQCSRSSIGGCLDSKPPARSLDEIYITYYTIGVRGDSRLSLLYLAQLLFASPIMWSCWNSCVDVDTDYPWVKRAAFITTWWITPATTATALTSVGWRAVLYATNTPTNNLWPALLGLYGRWRRCRAGLSVLCIGAMWCGTFWASANHFSAWFSMWV